MNLWVISIDRWCAGFRRSTARLWQVPCLDTSGFSLVFWLKTRLWQVSHMISGISQMFRMVVKMMPGIKILQVCDDFDEFVFFHDQMFYHWFFSIILSGMTQRRGKSSWLWWRSTDSNLPFLEMRLNVWTQKTTCNLVSAERVKHFCNAVPMDTLSFCRSWHEIIIYVEHN